MPGFDGRSKYLAAFPYVSSPNQGFEHRHHAVKGKDTPVDVSGVTTTTIDLNELNTSGMSGTATLTADGDKTKVVLKLTGVTGDNPVHIHSGTCAKLGEVVVALTDIDANGDSETTVDLKLADLLTGKYAINAHTSAKEINVYVACGDIVKA